MALSMENIASLTKKLDDGDRGGFYWEYYKLTGEYQSMIQGQITTYSGTWGGMAMVGNYLAKLADQESYNITLDQFSAAIISGTLLSIKSDEDGILDKYQMQVSDYSTWESLGMRELFPGNMQFAMSIEGWLFHRDKIFTEGTANSLWMGAQNIDIFSNEAYKPEELGNRFDEFQGERYEKIDLTGHPESDGRFLRVIDKLTGHLVFMQDTRPPEPFSSWLEVEIPGRPSVPLPGVGITWGAEDYREALSPGSPAFIARELLKAYVQADQAPGTQFIPNQVPPNVFFTHELNNGVRIETNELWHQEILNKIQALDAQSPLDFGARENLMSLYSREDNRGVEDFLRSMERRFLGQINPQPVLDQKQYADRMEALVTYLDDLGGSGDIARVIDLSMSSSSAILDIASRSDNMGMAYRYSLLHLDPLALIGDEQLYTKHNQSGELALESFSANYLADRAAMLSWLTSQGQLPDGQQVTDYTSQDGQHYKDYAGGQEVTVLPDPRDVFLPDVHRVFFGGDGADVLEGNKGNDRLYGGAGADILKGAAGRDYLEGGSGDDRLFGGKDNDTLAGGNGNDRYEFVTGDGNDTLIDSDRVGQIWIDGVHYTLAQRLAPGADSWHSKDGKVKFLLSGSDMLVLYGKGDSIRILNFVTGALGLGLKDFAPQVSGGAINGTADNDSLNGSSGSDLINGLEGSDRIFGGAGNDQIYGYKVDEFGVANPLSEGRGITGDWLDGGAGDDLLVGSNGQDGLFGGAGDDTIMGGGGNDIILADGVTSNLMPDLFLQVRSIAIGQDTQLVAYVSGAAGQAPLAQAGNDVVFAGEGNDFVDGYAGDDYLEGNAGHDYLHGGEGNDTLVGGTGNDTLIGDGFDGESEAMPSSRMPGDKHGNDLLIGGEGNDLIQGNGGHDRLFGDEGNDTLFGDDRTTPAQYHGNDYLDGGADNDILFGMGGDDTLLGGAGDDWLAGEDHLNSDDVSSFTGNDWLYGEAGNDTLLGGNGNDYLDGGADDDVLLGGDGQDTLLGGEGHDRLFGGAGNDTLLGGAGNDHLQGDSGSNLLDGGSGNDTLRGGSGDDRFVFGVGDGHDLIIDEGGNNRLMFSEGIERSSLQFQAFTSVTGTRYLQVSHGDDRVLIEDGLSGTIDRFEFADGSSLSLAEALQGVDIPLLFASENGDRLYGSDGVNEIHGGTGGDFIDAQGGDDRVYGGAGNDTLLGGGGADALRGGDGDDELYGGVGNDSLFGGYGNDWLGGDEGDDFLSGGSGNDTLAGGAGTNTYAFDWGMGQDLIEVSAGASSILKIAHDVIPVDLVTRQEGEDLLIGFKGALDGVRIKGYFTSAQEWQVESVDGLSSLDTFLAAISSDNSTILSVAERQFKQQVIADFDKRMQAQGAYLQEDGQYHSRKIYDSQTKRTEYNYSYRLTFLEEYDQYTVRPSYSSSSSSSYRVESTEQFHVGGGSSIGNSVGSVSGGSFISVEQFLRMVNNSGGVSGLFPVIGPGTGEIYENSQIIGWIDNPASSSGVDVGTGAVRVNKVYETYTNSETTKMKVAYGDDNGGYIMVYQGSIFHGGSGADSIHGALSDNGAFKHLGVFLDGGAGNDHLRGTANADVLIGGAGDDTLEGGQGADTYMILQGDGIDFISDDRPPVQITGYGQGDNGMAPVHAYSSALDEELDDVLVLPEGIGQADLQLAWGWAQSEVYVKDAVLYGANQGGLRAVMGVTTLDISWGSEQVVRLVMPFAHDPVGTGVDKIRFADGSTIVLGELIDQAGLGPMPDAYTTDQVLSRDAATGERTFSGGDGNDTLSGGGALYGGQGDDYLIGGDDRDYLVGGKGADTLIGGGGNDRLGASLDEYYGEGNTYRGGQGDDEIFASLSADTYLFERGDGHDRIFELGRLSYQDYSYSELDVYYGGRLHALWAGMPDEQVTELMAARFGPWRNPEILGEPDYRGLDTLQFGSQISPDDVRIDQDGSDLLIHFVGNSGDSIRFVNWTLFENKPLGTILFADGTVWDSTEIDIRLRTTRGTEEDDYLLGAAFQDDFLYGGAGHDTLYDYGGSNQLYGEEGDDTLRGGSGDDYLSGGVGDDWLYSSAGNDTLEGGEGNDVYALDSYRIEGSDTRIFDVDGIGSVTLDGLTIEGELLSATAENLWHALDGTFLLSLDPSTSTLTLRLLDEDGVPKAGQVVISSFSNGALGIELPAFEMPNNAPQAIGSLDEQAAISGQAWRYSLPAGSFFDSDGDDLTYSARLADGGDLPEWLHLDSVTGEFSGVTPGVRSMTLIITATDAAGASAQHSFSLIINPNRIEATQNGGPLYGTDGDDHLVGSSGQDIQWGGGGNDQLSGGARNDQLWGDDGDDLLDGGSGNDLLDGGAGNDQLQGGDGDDQLNGGVGSDALFGGAGSDQLRGDDGDDLLDGGSGNDLLDGGAGNDQLQGGDGDDQLNGGVGNDALFGGAGNDQLWGDDGDDLLDGGSGNDLLDGGAGNDQLQGGDGDDQLNGGAGSDTLFGGAGNDQLWGDDGDDLLDGGSGNDLLSGGAGDDQLRGGDGDDQLNGGVGSDTLFGGAGNDQLWGDDGDDLLDGGSGNDLLSGGAGDDQLRGGDGDDTLRGSTGNDYLIGSAGSDTYVFAVGDAQDVINNLSNTPDADTDLLQIEGVVREGLWLSRQGNHLVIDVMGTEDSVTIQNWYANSAQQLDVIRAGGSSLYANQVDSLVNAMAAFGAPAGGELDLTAVQRDQLNTIIAANWQ